MYKNILYSKTSFFFISSILIYLFFILGWYYKPPWMIDHLIYLHLANAENLKDLNFWYDSGVSVKEGHHTERWGVLIPLIIFSKVLFFLNPGEASTFLHIVIYLLIFIFIFLTLVRINSLSAYIFSILFVFGIHHTKNRATEVLADPYSILYLSIITYLFFLINEKNQRLIIYLVGLFFVFLVFTKIHYVLFILLFLFFFYKDIFFNLKYFILGCISSVILMEIFLVLVLNFNIFLQFNQNTISVLVGYIYGGLGVGDGPGNNGWSYEWIKLLANQIFLPFSFLVGMIFICTQGFKFENIFAWYSFFFICVILLLASFSNFPANDSYAYPVYIFIIPAISVFLANLRPANLNENIYLLLIFVMSVAPLLIIYSLGGVKSSKFFVSLNSLSILISLLILPVLLKMKKNFFLIFTILSIFSLDLLWHNWKNIENHSWWRNSYDWHHQYFDHISEFNLESGSYYVHLSEWPRIIDRDIREKMYIEPGIKSKTRSTLNIEAVVGNVDLDINENKTHLITDFEISLPHFNLIEKKDFITNEDSINRTIYFYKKINENK